MGHIPRVLNPSGVFYASSLQNERAFERNVMMMKVNLVPFCVGAAKKEIMSMNLLRIKCSQLALKCCLLPSPNFSLQMTP